MNEFELEIFEQTSDYSEFRLSGGEGLRTRGLGQGGDRGPDRGRGT